jgi:hypothetical protein
MKCVILYDDFIQGPVLDAVVTDADVEQVPISPSWLV